MQFSLVCLMLAVVTDTCSADVYFHNPRGSNNRLNEKSATRTTGNRLFDSQNNARGGYNVGDKGAEAADDQSEQYQMKYFQSSPKAKSHLKMEWTNQHGFGTNDKLNSNIVIQMLCETVNEKTLGLDSLRDGFDRNRQNFAKPAENLNYDQFLKKQKASVSAKRGLHESFYWYVKCITRDRNAGLFDADEISGTDSTKTRQNPNGNRNGYECPEERDYYPYFHPNPWKDIAILTSNLPDCKTYQTESFNVKPRGECVSYYDNNGAKIAKSLTPNNQKDCEAQTDAKWITLNNYLEVLEDITSSSDCTKKGFKWGLTMNNYVTPQCYVPLAAPQCLKGAFTRVNHLGNAQGSVEMINYDYEIPYFPSGKEQRCVFRMRYNISTNDYDPKNTFENTNPATFKNEDDPKVNVGTDADQIKLQVNVDLNQFGRTFQDRSHVSLLKPRPEELTNEVIHNLNVRGKRGNIVQVYPAVEYDFTPTNLAIKRGETVHVQWTGSNTHNNGAPGGDGQTGDEGQGTGGTDRSNILGMDDLNHNYPYAFEAKDNIFQNIQEVVWHYKNPASSMSSDDMAVSAASSGYVNSMTELNELPDVGSKAKRGQKASLNVLLNNAPASYEGAVIKFNSGEYNYMCTRNNNFSNRSQKGKLIVRG